MSNSLVFKVYTLESAEKFADRHAVIRLVPDLEGALIGLLIVHDDKGGNMDVSIEAPWVAMATKTSWSYSGP